MVLVSSLYHSKMSSTTILFVVVAGFVMCGSLSGSQVVTLPVVNQLLGLKLSFRSQDEKTLGSTSVSVMDTHKT
jgi:hypothetical protein